MSLVDKIARAAAPGAPVLIKCQRCQCLRVPARDPGVVLCRACLAEVEQLGADDTGDGPILGHA